MRFAPLSSDDPDIASHLMDLSIAYDQLTDEERAYVDAHVDAIERAHAESPVPHLRRRRGVTKAAAAGTPSTSA